MAVSGSLWPSSEIRNPEITALHDSALEFLAQFPWCGEVVESHVAFAIPDGLGVFRLNFTPLAEWVDSPIWVVVGDLPPAYLAYDSSDTWQDALTGYVVEMRRWVEAVERGEPTDDLIPIGAEETLEHAEMLTSRLEFIESELLAEPADGFQFDL